MKERSQGETKILLTTEISDEKTAASKARMDVSEILTAEGYQKLHLPVKMTLKNIWQFRKSLYNMAKGSATVVIEYPFTQRKRMYIVYLFCKLKGIKLYGIIHDIVALRSPASAKKDVSILRLFDGLISHNYSMTAWLKDQGYSKPVVNLNLFDYLLTDSRTFNESDFSNNIKVLYAGNLAYNKSTFIYNEGLGKLEKVNVHLFGVDFDRERINGSKIVYKGVFNPGSPDLPEKYHFGLIWDGKSLDTCDGMTGEYMRYNNPHKLSLYLALGLPVIVWKEAAIAKFVLENKVGIVLESLNELKQIDKVVSKESYQNYINNISDISAKVRKGYFLSAALQKLSTL